jgi:hypothetical protein
MNINEVAWVSGWASDISAWESEIYEQFPNYSHRFIDYFDFLPNPDDFWDKNPRIAEASAVVGWSMGPLALLRNLHKKPPEQKWFLLSPIADFCAEGCSPAAAVRAMRQGILENTEKTLMSFSALMGDMQREDREKWVECALRYSPKQLAAGLDYLQTATAVGATPRGCPAVAQKDTKNNAQNIELIFGEKDQVAPIAQKELFSRLFPEFSSRVEDTGHFFLPYLLCLTLK